MATITKGRTFVSGEVVTPTKLNTLVDSATVTGIVDADIAGPITGAGKVANSATTATSANTASAIVARDASGNFSAGTITATSFVGSGASLTGITTVPPGAVMPFAMNSAPSGWLAADGSTVSRATFSVLFAAIGTLYGVGDGSTTFNLPDLRGYFVRGTGTNSDGTSSGAFAAKQADQFQGHVHGGVPHYGHNTLSQNNAPTANWNVAVNTAGPLSDGINGTPRVGAETRPRNIAMLYCIKA